MGDLSEGARYRIYSTAGCQYRNENHERRNDGTVLDGIRASLGVDDGRQPERRSKQLVRRDVDVATLDLALAEKARGVRGKEMRALRLQNRGNVREV